MAVNLKERLKSIRLTGLPWGRWVANLIWLGGAAVVLGAIFGLTFLGSLRSEQRSLQVEVPNLSGMNFERAAIALEPLELTPQVIDERNDPLIPVGEVLIQEPPAGTKVKRGRKIKLVVSLGDRAMAVPSLIGRGARAVTLELQRAGFAPGHEVNVPIRGVTRGDVVAQVPPPETAAVPNTRVHRLVSAGPREPVWVMPDFRGRQRAAVEDWLRGKGFRLAVRQVRYANASPESIVGQLPLAGFPLKSNGVVELTVAQ